MFFVDSTVFIKWVSARRILTLEEAISGYVLFKISRGEEALTTTLVKDEVLIWISRYRVNKIKDFMTNLRALFSLNIIHPTLEDEWNAVHKIGKYPLGISDLINLSVMERLGIKDIVSLDKGFDSYPNVRRIFYELKREEGFRDFLEILHQRNMRVEGLRL